MNMTQSAPTLLLLFTLVMLFLGVLILIWGHKLPGKGSWLVSGGILLFLVGVGFETGIILSEPFRVKTWWTGWILSRDTPVSISVGIVQDLLAFSIGTLSVLLTAGMLMGLDNHASEHPEKSHAALAISTAGVCLAALALTPWLIFAGLVLTILGGFISFGPKWEKDSEASVAVRLTSERSAGFIIAFFGACILASSEVSLILLNQPEVWGQHHPAPPSAWVGSLLMIAGLFIQLTPFPFLGWVVSDSHQHHPLRILLNQLFPAWAAFILLIRLQPQFVGLGLFEGFGWISLITTVLATLTGLFQSRWRSGLSVWVISGLSLSCALLAFAGPTQAVSLLMGVSLGALCLSTVATALERKSTQSVVHRQKARWLKASAFLGVSAGTGMIGFVSANGGLHWIANTIEMPGVLSIFLVVFFLYILLGWQMAWKISGISSVSDASLGIIISSFFWILLSMGVVWTGTITGEVLIGAPDRVLPSLLSAMDLFSAKPEPDMAQFVSASGFYWGVLICAMAGAYWSTGRKGDRWARIALLIPRVTRFLASGYRVDQVILKTEQGLIWFGSVAVKVVDRQIWSEWIPNGLSKGLKILSIKFNFVDDSMSRSMTGFLKKLVEVPGKSLQLIQTGDLRWYLFLALSSGFALFAHFFKT